MKNISEIQNIIKSEERLCIFVDYNTLAENLERMYASDARESRGLRIVRNFLNCPFLQIYVIVKKNTPKKAVNYVEISYIMKSKRLNSFVQKLTVIINSCMSVIMKM